MMAEELSFNPDDSPHAVTRDPKLALLCFAIVSQQRAGFGSLIDARTFPCPTCAAPGFNFGWGAIHHTCGAEILTTGEVAEPCPTEGKSS